MKTLRKYIRNYLKNTSSGRFALQQIGKFRDSVRRTGTTKVNVVKEFPMFAPNSTGAYRTWEPLVLDGLRNGISKIAWVVESTTSYSIPIIEIEDLEPKEFDEKWRTAFASFGSDKATTHNYFKVYSRLICDHSSLGRLLEIGLGTNNPSVLSNMGLYGSPGASLRAFKALLPNYDLYGADFDREILFEEDRIKTCFTDQNNPSELQNLISSFGDNFDLLIDDGLHTPIANLNSFYVFDKMVRPGGYIVIEDVPDGALDIWSLVGSSIKEKYECTIYKGRNGSMFVAQKS